MLYFAWSFTEEKTASLFSAHIYKIEGKSSTQNAQIRRFFKADLPIENVPLLTAVSGPNLDKFSSPNQSKFSVA